MDIHRLHRTKKMQAIKHKTNQLIHDGVLVWSGGFLAMAWECYMAYGDLTLIRNHYDNFRKWADFLVSIQESDGLSRGHCNYGDHLAKDCPSREFIENAHAFRSFRFMEKFAELTGSPNDVNMYREQAEKLRKAINAHLFNNGVYGDGTQSEAVHALYLGITEDAKRAEMLDELCIQLENELCFRTGIIGTELLMRLLGDEGRNDLAWKLAMSDKLYTWRYWIKHGATTVLESWILKKVNSPVNVSQNHPALGGGIAYWFYRELSGIKPLSPGYRDVSIKPFIPDGVENLTASIYSPFGNIESSWYSKAGEALLKVNIPPGCRGTLNIPEQEKELSIGSGIYEFKWQTYSSDL
jgi:alpha-L-rhamnosidase